MTRAIREWGARVVALAGLATSSMLLFDYLQPVATFCGRGGGCDVVKQSGWAHAGPVPTPAFGVSFFAVAILLTLLPMVEEARARRLLALVTGVGAAVAIVLLGVQAFVLKTFCTYCVITDTSAIVLFGLVLSLPRGSRAPVGTPRLLYAVGAALAILVPIVVGTARLPEAAAMKGVPEVVLREQRAAVATIVEFIDFECPYCRKQHAQLEEILPAYGEQVRVVRKNVPLPMHAHAVTAAKAYCCADAVGKGAEMANAIMTSDDLTREGCERLALGLGVDAEPYRACLESPATIKRLETELDEAIAAEVGGLPTFFIGVERFEGLQEEADVRASIDRAIGDAKK